MLRRRRSRARRARSTGSPSIAEEAAARSPHCDERGSRSRPASRPATRRAAFSPRALETVLRQPAHRLHADRIEAGRRRGTGGSRAEGGSSCMALKTTSIEVFASNGKPPSEETDRGSRRRHRRRCAESNASPPPRLLGGQVLGRPDDEPPGRVILRPGGSSPRLRRLLRFQPLRAHDRRTAWSPFSTSFAIPKSQTLTRSVGVPSSASPPEEQDVLGLQIPVQDARCVRLPEPGQHLARERRPAARARAASLR